MSSVLSIRVYPSHYLFSIDAPLCDRYLVVYDIVPKRNAPLVVQAGSLCSRARMGDVITFAVEYPFAAGKPCVFIGTKPPHSGGVSVNDRTSDTHLAGGYIKSCLLTMLSSTKFEFEISILASI